MMKHTSFNNLLVHFLNIQACDIEVSIYIFLLWAEQVLEAGLLFIYEIQGLSTLCHLVDLY